jgi:hypothetical protein
MIDPSEVAHSYGHFGLRAHGIERQSTHVLDAYPIHFASWRWRGSRWLHIKR